MSNHLDVSALKELKEVMDDDFQLLIETYIEDTDARVNTLATCIDQQDAEEIKKIAHSIKGSSSNLFAQNLASLCQKIEDMGRVGSFEGVQEMMVQVKTEYASVREELQNLL